MKVLGNRWLGVWWVAISIFGTMILTLGPTRTFACWGIDTTHPDFADIRGITSAMESHRLGFDPLVENSRDPFGRAFNYPRAWLGLSPLGLDQSHSTILGHCLIGLFLLGLLLFIPTDIDWSALGLLMPVAFSPAGILGMERGNIDVLMFFLVAVGIAGVAGEKLICKTLGVASVLLGFVFKLYPLFGLAMLLDAPHRRVLRRHLWIPLVAGLYLILIRHDLALIYQSTPKSTGLSYGMNVMWMELAEHGRNLGLAARLLALVGVGVAASLAWMGYRRAVADLPDIGMTKKSLVAFRAGAGIYLGTFLLGNNWDYRLIFLIFTLSLLAIFIRGGSKSQRRVAAIVAAGTLVSCWHITLYHVFHALPLGSPACVLLDECANWTVFLRLSFLFGNTIVNATLNGNSDVAC